ncbi:hypothetical protein Droror1_Dr00018180 [Drosera rotundifolia]
MGIGPVRGGEWYPRPRSPNPKPVPIPAPIPVGELFSSTILAPNGERGSPQGFGESVKNQNARIELPAGEDFRSKTQSNTNSSSPITLLNQPKTRDFPTKENTVHPSSTAIYRHHPAILHNPSTATLIIHTKDSKYPATATIQINQPPIHHQTPKPPYLPCTFPTGTSQTTHRHLPPPSAQQWDSARRRLRAGQADGGEQRRWRRGD